MKKHLFTFSSATAPILILSLAGCAALPERPSSASPRTTESEYETVGHIERLHPELDQLIPPGAVIERLASGFAWSEGPVWVRSGNYLLFSDIPNNVVYKWNEGTGLEEFLKPSGYTGLTPRGGEPGSNGLALDAQGRLILCEHGDRRITRLEKDGSKTILARYFQWRRFNSPNDLVFKSNGDLYFTDPPYGLPLRNNDPTKELGFNGVYRLSPNGTITLLTPELTYPNGIAFSPDEKTLYVAVSDPEQAIWMAYDLLPDGTLGQGAVFFDATHMVNREKGLPDGLKVDKTGNIFATGPGGVLVFSPQGRHLGTINTGEATANCGWGNDGSVLYITAHSHLLRIRTNTKGLGF